MHTSRKHYDVRPSNPSEGYVSGPFNQPLRGRRPLSFFGFRVYEEGIGAQARELVRTDFETCRGVPFKGRKLTAGCRSKEASEIGV